MEHIIDNVVVCVKNGTIPEEEAAAYVARGRERFGSDLKQIIATLDPDDPEMIDLEYITPPKSSTGSAESPAIWWAIWADGTTPSEPKRAIA